MVDPNHHRINDELELRQELDQLRKQHSDLTDQYHEAQIEIERLHKELQEAIKQKDVISDRERRLRNILEFSPDGMLLADSQGTIIEWNPGAELITGLKSDEVLGRLLWNVQSGLGKPEGRTMERSAELKRQILALFDSDKKPWQPITTRTEIFTPEGTLRVMNSLTFLIKTLHGIWIGSILRDITDEIQSEQALRKSRERLALALQGANDGLWDWNIETGEFYYSPRWKSMLGYADHEIGNTQNSWKILMDPEDWARTNGLLQDYLSGALDKFEIELRMRHKNGHYVDILSRAFAVRRTSDGQPIRVVGTHVDITARKHAEQALRASRRLLYTTVNSAPIVLFSLDQNGVFTLSEGQALEKLNLRPGELVGRSIADVYQDTPKIIEHSQRALAGEVLSVNEQVNGTLFETHYSPLRNQEGEIIGVVGVSTDVSERARAEEALRLAKSVAETANRAKSTFLANMSHELRTPLNGILGYAQILKSDVSLNDKQHEAVDIIERSGEHLLMLVNDVLDLSKVEAGKMEPVLTVFNLPRFIDSITLMFETRAQLKGLDFEYKPLSALPTAVRGDELRLRQVLINLLSNAVKFTTSGKVTLEIGYHFDKIRFQVIDTGPGIKPEDQEAIFVPFQQAGDQQSMVEGTGLGLSISSRLVDLMGGKLEVESEVGEGSVFWFDLTLPVVEGWTRDGEGERERIVGYQEPVRKILIVDDVAANRSLICDMLVPLGFDVIEAEDGIQAIEMVNDEVPDLVLIDLVMPLMDGFEAARRIRQIPNLNKHIPIVTVSASAFGEHRRLSMEAGCDGFLAKPFGLQALVRELQTHLDLEWIYEDQEADDSKIEPTPTYKLPPYEKLQEMYTLAKTGQVIKFNQVLEDLQVQSSAYDLFIMEMRNMAQDFKFKKIRSRLQIYIYGVNGGTSTEVPSRGE